MQTMNPNTPQSATPDSATSGQPSVGRQSGFTPIPTRMSDLAPLVVKPDAGTSEAVREQLAELDEQMASIHGISAEAWVNQGNHEEARKHAEMAYALTPRDPGIANQCGYLRYMAEDDAGAIQVFTRILEVVPEQIDALVNLGTVEFGRENWEVAKSWFLRAVRQSPDDAEIWNNLGACIFQSGNAAEASAYFRKALELDPHNEDAKANLACC